MIQHMFNVRMSSVSLEQLQSFITSYKDLFLSLYSDTGLVDEALIRKNYITVSQKFDREIHDIQFYKK